MQAIEPAIANLSTDEWVKLLPSVDRSSPLLQPLLARIAGSSGTPREAAHKALRFVKQQNVVDAVILNSLARELLPLIGTGLDAKLANDIVEYRPLLAASRELTFSVLRHSW